MSRSGPLIFFFGADDPEEVLPPKFKGGGLLFAGLEDPPNKLDIIPDDPPLNNILVPKYTAAFINTIPAKRNSGGH